MISIKSEDFSENYDLFVKLCEITAEPLRLTKDGEPDMIVMNAAAYERRKKMLDLREKLLRVNEEDSFASRGISLEELGQYDDLMKYRAFSLTFFWKYPIIFL